MFFAGDACREALVQQGRWPSNHTSPQTHICFWFTYGFQMILLYATKQLYIYGYPVVSCQSSPRIFHHYWLPTLVGKQEGVMDDTLRVIEFGRCRVERRQGAGCGHGMGWAPSNIIKSWEGEQIEQDFKIASCFIVWMFIHLTTASQPEPHGTLESIEVEDMFLLCRIES